MTHVQAQRVSDRVLELVSIELLHTGADSNPREIVLGLIMGLFSMLYTAPRLDGPPSLLPLQEALQSCAQDLLVAAKGEVS